jgi:hypothetical protein
MKPFNEQSLCGKHHAEINTIVKLSRVSVVVSFHHYNEIPEATNL